MVDRVVSLYCGDRNVDAPLKGTARSTAIRGEAESFPLQIYKEQRMIKTIVTMVVTAVAGLVGYLVSDSFRERLAQKQRDKIASEWIVPRRIMTQLVIASEKL